MRRVTYHTFIIKNLEEASLSITREFQPDDLLDESNLMFAISSYVAENSETLNLVEGERLYVIGTIGLKFNRSHRFSIN